MSREIWVVSATTAGNAVDPEETHFFGDMDAALESFVNEVAYTIEHLLATVEEATAEDVGLAELDQRYGIDKEKTISAYRSVLEGDPDMGALPAVSVEQRIPWGNTAWVHVMEKMTISDEWYDQNKGEVQ